MHVPAFIPSGIIDDKWKSSDFKINTHVCYLVYKISKTLVCLLEVNLSNQMITKTDWMRSLFYNIHSIPLF